jgi:hypothetical protein
MNSAGAESLARQQLLSHTLEIARQDPSQERSIVLAPQRMPTAAQATAMASALGTLQREADWVTFTDLSQAASATPDPDANRQVPSSADYPERLRRTELPTGAFQAMRETQRSLDDFVVILTQPERVTVPYGNALHREMSTSWRGNPQGADEYRSGVLSDLTDLTDQVQLIQKSDITLSGRSATIPVTVQNNLLQDVQGLELRLTSSRRLGLEVADPQQVVVGSGHSQSVKFSAAARANGPVTLVAQLYTADGKPYGDPMVFEAQVTSITSQVMMVIAGGLLLVVLAGIRMYTQRRRAARAGAPTDEDPDAPVGEPAPDMGESAPDTRRDSTGTPVGNERLGSDE